MMPKGMKRNEQKNSERKAVITEHCKKFQK
jgi:hypothetical protein